MNRKLFRLGLAFSAASLLLGACAGSVSDKHTIVEPATVEQYDDQETARITLSEQAMQRLDIQTTPVVQNNEWLVVPSSAIFVDATGTFWLYTSPEPLVFLRQEIGLAHEEGDQAYLSDGPDPGVSVVTVGVPELYGLESGIGH